jgi:hypothetical protein
MARGARSDKAILQWMTDAERLLPRQREFEVAVLLQVTGPRTASSRFTLISGAPRARQLVPSPGGMSGSAARGSGEASATDVDAAQQRHSASAVENAWIARDDRSCVEGNPTQRQKLSRIPLQYER